MFDINSVIDNYLKEKSVKKSIISVIYGENIGSVTHTRINLIFDKISGYIKDTS